MEQNIVSVERMMHYISLPSEAPYEIAGVVNETWPDRGEMEFRNYSTKYRPELDLVLKNVSFIIVSDTLPFFAAFSLTDFFDVSSTQEKK